MPAKTAEQRMQGLASATAHISTFHSAVKARAISHLKCSSNDTRNKASTSGGEIGLASSRSGASNCAQCILPHAKLRRVRALL